MRVDIDSVAQMEICFASTAHDPCSEVSSVETSSRRVYDKEELTVKSHDGVEALALEELRDARVVPQIDAEGPDTVLAAGRDGRGANIGGHDLEVWIVVQEQADGLGSDEAAAKIKRRHQRRS